MKCKSISRGTVLRHGIIFLSFGIFFMFFKAPTVRLVGSVEIFIGSLSLIIYNSEKYKYFKLLHNSLLQKGYNVTFKKQRLFCLFLCFALFFCNLFSWSYLLYVSIISKIVFNIVGIVFTLLLLPVLLSTDNMEKQLADESANKFIDIMTHEQKL